MTVAERYSDGGTREFTPVAAVLGGAVIQAIDGFIAVSPDAVAAAYQGSLQIGGVYDVAKTTLEIILPGQRVYFDKSAGSATVVPDITVSQPFLGTCVSDAAAADANVRICLGVDGPGLWDQRCDSAATLITGAATVAQVGGGLRLALDNTSEVQKADAWGYQGCVKADDFLFFAEVNNDVTAGSTVDFNIGVSTATHASDFEAASGSFVAFQIDGAGSAVNVHSDDGSTDVALEDSLANFTVGTPFVVAIDGRDPDDCLMYVNGILEAAGTTKVLTNTGAADVLRPIAHVEKTTGTAVGTYTVSHMKLITADL